MPDKQVQPGQLTTIPASNYDVNKDLGRVTDRTGVVDAPTAPNLLYGYGAPMTPTGESKVNPAYAAYIGTLRNNPVNQLQTPYYTNEKMAERYTNNEFGGYNPFDINQENWYGENQGWFSQWGNRLGKFAIKAAGSFANSLMDIPNVINAIDEGNIDKLWDNQMNTWASDLMEWSEKNMPNYETNWEREHPFLNLVPFYGNSGNGWGKVLENVGFTVGAIGGAVVEDIAVGALTGGVGEIPLMAVQINKALYKLGKIAGNSDDVMSGLKTSITSADNIIKGLKGVDRLNYATRQGIWGANMITSGFSEAAFEGIESHKTLVKDLQTQFFEENGRNANYEESQKIEQTARSAGNARFLFNAALLAATNTIQWGSLLRPFNVTKELAEAEVKSGFRVGLKEGSNDVFEAVAPKSKLLRFGKALASNKAVTTVTGSASEGFEEGAQFLIQTGVDDYYKRQYDSEAIGNTNNFMKSFSAGLAKTLGTQEGWENIVYGLLGGTMYKAGEHVYYKGRGMESPNYKKELDAVIQGLNSQSLTGIFENKYSEGVAAAAIEKDMNKAVKEGNLFKYQNYKHEHFVNFVLSGIKQNKFETRLDQLESLKRLDDNEFAKTFGIPSTSENRKTAAEYASAMQENAKYIKDVHNRVSRTFVNPYSYKGTGNYKSKEQAALQQTENEKYQAYEGVKEQLVYSMAVAKDSAKRTQVLTDYLNTYGGIGFSATDAIDLESEEGLKRFKERKTQQARDLSALLKENFNKEQVKEIKKEISDLLLSIKQGRADKSLESRAYGLRASLQSSKKQIKEDYLAAMAQVELIDSIFDEKDENAKTDKYNKFVTAYYAKLAADKAAFYKSINNANPEDQFFSPSAVKDLRETARDIVLLQERNRVAIDRYARLTTPGGFKGLFDEIIALRKAKADEVVNLEPEKEQPKNEQAQQALDQSAVQQGTQSSEVKPDGSVELQGFETETNMALDDPNLDPEIRARLKQLAIDVVDKKVVGTYADLEGLGFKTIDDLKYADSNVDLNQYYSAKTDEGRNMYILKSIIDGLRKNINNTGVTPPVTPADVQPAATKDKEPLRTEDFLNKVWIPQDLMIPFQDTLWSGNFKESVQVRVAQLAPPDQQAYDEQRDKGTYTPVKGYEGVFVSKSPVDISLETKDGKVIGKMPFPERLLFKVDNQLVTIDKLTPQQYAALTGRPAVTHKADVEAFNKYKSFKNYLAMLFKNNNNQPVVLSNKEFNELVNFELTYGEDDRVESDTQRPLYNTVKHNTVKLKAADGSTVSTMAILSIPKRYSADTATRQKTEDIRVAFNQSFYDNEGVDDRKIRSWMNVSVKDIHKVGSRYIGVVEQPNGLYRMVALRPAQITADQKEELFKSLKDRSTESVNTNFIEVTDPAEATGRILFGDAELLYKLPNDAAKSYNDNFNTDLNNKIFITDPNGKSWFNLSLSPVGALRLEIFEPNSETSTTIFVSPVKMQTVSSFDEMVNELNKEIKRRSIKDAKLLALKINVTPANFRQNIENDGTLNAEQLAALLSSANSVQGYKNGTVRFNPNSQKVTSAYTGEKAKESKQEEPVATTEPVQQAPTALPTGLFGGFQQLNVDDTGSFAPQDIPSETPVQTKTSIANQEDLSQVEFATADEALKHADIKATPSAQGYTYVDMASGEVIDAFKDMTPAQVADTLGYNVTPPKPSKGGTFDFLRVDNGAKDVARLIDIEKTQTYLNSILPSFIKVEELDTVMDNLSEQGIDDAQATIFGAFKNGTIYLNKNVEDIGQGYHEAFHAVFQMLLTSEEQNKLLTYAGEQVYKELKSKKKSIRDVVAENRSKGIWTNLTDGQAADKVAEEWMAEKFRAWKTKKQPVGLLDKFFDLIERFFKWMLRSGNDMDALFRNIDTGAYRYSNVVANNFITDATEEYVEPEFSFMLIPARPGKLQIGKREVTIKRNMDAKTSKQKVQEVAAYYNMYKAQPQFKYDSDEKILNRVLDDLKNLYSANNPVYAGYPEDIMNEIVNSDLSFIYSNQASRDIIKEEAKKYIDSIKYIEQFKDEEQEEGESDNGQPSTGYDNTAENKGGFSSLPGLLRQYIGFITFNKVDPFGNKQLIKDVPVIGTVDAVAVYYGLMRSLANITDPVRFFQKMIHFADDNEQSRYFVDKFIADTGLNVIKLMQDGVIEANRNPALLELIKKGFNKFRIDYVFTEHDVKKGLVKSYHANRKNVENVQFDKWANTFIAKYSEYSEDSQKQYREQLRDATGKYFDPRRNIKYSTEKLLEASSEVKKALNGVGINVSNAYVKYSLLHNNAKKYDELSEQYKKDGVELSFDDPANKFISEQDYKYVQIMKVADETVITPEFLNELVSTLAANNNPYFKTTKTQSYYDEDLNTSITEEVEMDTAMIGRILNIAKGNASFDESVGESSYTNAENKVVYAHQDGTFNVKFSYQLRDDNYRKQLREKGYREEATAYRDVYDSAWLTDNFLLNSDRFDAIANNMLVQRIDGMRAVETNKLGNVITKEFRDQKEGATYGHYSPREILVNMMNLYMSYSKEQKTSKGSIMTTPHIIRILEASKTVDTVNLPVNIDMYKAGSITTKAADILYKEFEKEFNRITRVQGEIGTIKDNVVDKYHTGSFAEDGVTVVSGYRGLKFTDNITSLISSATAQEMEALARNGSTPSAEQIADIKGQITAAMNSLVTDTVNVMTREGIVKEQDGKYFNVLLHNDFFNGNAALNLGKYFVENVGQVVINDYINTLAYNQILHGDPALSLKNDGGIDAVKRAKGDNAAIVSMRTDTVAPELGITEPFTHSSVAIFKEPKGFSKELNTSVDVADAQMYTTVKGLRYTLWGLGRLTPRVANFLDALERGDDIHNLKDSEGNTFDGVFDKDLGLLKWDEMTNSLKLVYKDGKSYFKMSVVVLQPDLTSYVNKAGERVTRPGWKTLDDLRNKMEQEGIHFAAPQSASKMLTMDVGQAKDFSDLKGHLFDNTYFGLQTVNPSNKMEITTPTQLIQLIDSEQDDSVVVNIDGKDTTIGEVKSSYQSYVSQKVNNSYETAKRDIYEIKDFNADVAESIAKGEVTPRLAKFQKRAIETLEASGADAQLLDFFSLDESGNPKFNLNMSATKTKFGQLYLAYFSKGILSQKNPGYTVALFSAIDTKLIKKATRIKNGEVIEWEVVRRQQFDSNFKNIQNEAIVDSPDAVTEEGQYFLDELRYNVPERDDDGNIIEGRFYSEMMMPPHDANMLKINRMDQLPDAIAKMFGVRIPSQDKHSFMSFRMVDFLPANLGSTAVFPKELIALSGADFDIDKEYISRYDYYNYRDNRGNVKFAKFGDAENIEGKWEEYKLWMGKNNKVVKNIMKDIAAEDAEYQQFIVTEPTDSLMDDLLGLNVTAEKRKQFKDKFIPMALKQAGLPSTLKEFEEISKTKELNNGVLNNKIVDSYVALLTNKGMRDIAKTPATMSALAKIQDEGDIQLKDKSGKPMRSVFSKNTKYPVDSIIGKYYSFKNNTTGKDNIGIDVNANLIYSVLNKGSIKLTAQGFVFDGKEFGSFDGNNQYNLETKQFDGARTNDILSTLISSATDEAKEQLNALYGLNVDALKVVNYLIALKVPLKTAIYLVNQPSIRNYLNIKSINNNTIKAPSEENLFSSMFQQEALQKTFDEIKDYKDYSDDTLFDVLEKSGSVEVEC